MEPVGDILAHYGRITGMIWTEVAIDGTVEQWILSTSRDKRFQYHNAKNGNPIGPPFVCAAWCTSLEYPLNKKLSYVIRIVFSSFINKTIVIIHINIILFIKLIIFIGYKYNCDCITYVYV